MKRLLLLGLLLIGLCAGARAEGPRVVTTDFPCYDIVRAVAGDTAEITMLIRPGTEAHSYDPTPSDILKVESADLFVFIGGESDVWADSVLSGADGEPKVLRLIDRVTALEEEGEPHQDSEAPEMDEHIWTSPKNELVMVRAAEEALCGIDPENAALYHGNADAYCAEIQRQDEELTALTREAANRTIVVADRFPFLYLAHDYGLSYASAFASCASDTEPTAKILVGLIDTIRREGLTRVYVIEMSNRAIARTISEETGAGILELHSMQTVTQREFEAGETYVTLMDKNIAALRKGLLGDEDA